MLSDDSMASASESATISATRSKWWLPERALHDGAEDAGKFDKVLVARHAEATTVEILN